VPELEFKEEDPFKNVAPTMAKQEEILSAVQTQGEAQLPKMRFAEWSGPAESTSVGKAPLWLISIVSVLMWVSTVKLFLVPLPSSQLLANSKDTIVDQALITLLVIMGLIFVMLIPLAVIEGVEKARFRRRFPNLRDVSHVSFVPKLRPGNGPQGAMSGTVLLRQNGILYGDDQGHLHYDGGSLYFEGLRTSFSISKSRLTLRPRVKGIRRVFRTSEFSENLETRLDYREGGQDFQIGLLAQPLDYQTELPNFRAWLALSSEPAEFEVLPPRTLPKSAKRDAIKALTLPLLALQGMLFMVCYVVDLWQVIPGFGFRGPSGIGWFGSLLLTFLTVVLIVVMLPMSVMGVLRGIRRYQLVIRDSG
jgi:hypothetical protein